MRAFRNILYFVVGILFATVLTFNSAYAAIDLVICGNQDSTAVPGTAVPGKSGYVYDAGGCPTLNQTNNEKSPNATSSGQSLDTIQLESTSTSAPVKNYIQIGNKVMYIPSGWSSDSSTGLPVPPSSTAKVTTYSSAAWNAPGPYDTIDATCAAIQTINRNGGGGSNCSATFTATRSGSTCVTSNVGSCSASPITPVATSVCPTGYTDVGGACYTSGSNAANVKKPLDGRCNVIKSGATYSGDPNDPDCSLTANQGRAPVSGNAAAVYGSGVSAWNYNSTTNSMTIGDTKYDAGTNSTTNTVLNVDATSGLILEKSTSVSSGTSNTPNANDPAIANTPAAVQVDTSALATHSDVNATTTAVNSLGSKMDTLHSDLTTAPSGSNSASGVGSDISTAATATQNAVTAIGTSGLDQHGVTWDWSPSLPSAACSPWVYSVGGHTATLDVCPVADKIRTLLAYSLYLLTAWSIFFVFTRRSEA